MCFLFTNKKNAPTVLPHFTLILASFLNREVTVRRMKTVASGILASNPLEDFASCTYPSRHETVDAF